MKEKEEEKEKERSNRLHLLSPFYVSGPDWRAYLILTTSYEGSSISLRFRYGN